MCVGNEMSGGVSLSSGQNVKLNVTATGRSGQGKKIFGEILHFEAPYSMSRDQVQYSKYFIIFDMISK